MTPPEKRLWNEVFLACTRTNIRLGKFSWNLLPNPQYVWPFLWDCQEDAARLADYAVIQARAGKLIWP